MALTHKLERPALAVAPWPTWPYIVFLVVLFLGPLAAPLFQATRVPLMVGAGALARDLLSLYICPTPAKSYMLLGFPMAVCSRCWGGTIGLWLAWLFVRRPEPLVLRWPELGRQWARYLAVSWPLRFAVSALPFWLWVIEIVRWPAAPYWFLLVNGAFAGLWAGLFFCSVWPGMLRRDA